MFARHISCSSVSAGVWRLTCRLFEHEPPPRTVSRYLSPAYRSRHASMMGSNPVERPGMGRVLVSAHTYQPEGVSEGFTAAQLVAAMRQRGYRVTVLTAALRRLKYGFGVLGVHCSTNTEIAYFSPANYLEYSARSLLMMRRLRKRFALVHQDRKSTRLNSSHLGISYAVFCLK